MNVHPNRPPYEPACASVASGTPHTTATTPQSSLLAPGLGWGDRTSANFGTFTSGKLHKDYTVYEDVKSILPIYIHVYPVRPCRDDLCEIIPSIWGAVARYDRSDLFIIACGQSHLFMNMLWSAMISCELSYLVATVLLVLCGDVFRHKIIEWKFELKSIFRPCLWLGDHLGEKT